MVQQRTKEKKKKKTVESERAKITWVETIIEVREMGIYVRYFFQPTQRPATRHTIFVRFYMYDASCDHTFAWPGWWTPLLVMRSVRSGLCEHIVNKLPNRFCLHELEVIVWKVGYCCSPPLQPIGCVVWPEHTGIIVVECTVKMHVT